MSIESIEDIKRLKKIGKIVAEVRDEVITTPPKANGVYHSRNSLLLFAILAV